MKNYAPKNPLKWYEVYKRYKREQAEEIKRDEEILRETMMGIKKARDNSISKIVDLGSLPKLPRDPRMTLNNGGAPISRSALKKETSSTWSFAGGSRTKMNNGKSILTRARREAKEIAQMGKLSRPTHQLSVGRVTKAPAAMIKEYRTASKPELKVLSRRSATKPPQTGDTMLEDREERLRALTSNTKSNDVKPNFVDADDESEGDELFNGSPANSPKQSSMQSTLHMTKTKPSKKPSDIITVMLKKPSTSSRYVTVKKNTANLSQNYTPSDTSTSRRLPLETNGNTNSNSPDSITYCAPANSSSSAIHSASHKQIMPNKRKPVDIFNRSASKRPKARP